MRVLLSCVNTAVSLVGYDIDAHAAFWYCPANRLRACGISIHENALWVASDAAVTRVTATGAEMISLPGPHHNYAHSIHYLGDGLLGVADTGNSRVLAIGGASASLSYSPLDGWDQKHVPEDAIHLNDFLPWGRGILASAFSYQPFDRWRHSELQWKSEGWGVLLEMKRYKGHTISRIVASGLDCPHSLVLHNNDVYCCSSAHGEFMRFATSDYGILRLAEKVKVTDHHFLRGALRLEDGWLLGGSSTRKIADGGGMCLYMLRDNGGVEEWQLGGPGEIYDILPWEDSLMPGIADRLLKLPVLDIDGEFPPDCILPDKYRG